MLTLLAVEQHTCFDFFWFEDQHTTYDIFWTTHINFDTLSEEQKDIAVADVVMRKFQLLMNVEDSLKQLRKSVDENTEQKTKNYLFTNSDYMRFLKIDDWVNLLKRNLHVFVDKKSHIFIHIDVS